MFKDSIAGRVKKVLADRIKNAEAEYKECKDKNSEAFMKKMEVAQAERAEQDLVAADTIVSKVLGG